MAAAMKEWLEKKNGKVKPDEFVDELRILQVTKCIDEKKRFYAALEALFPAGTMDAKAVEDQGKVISKVITSGKQISAHDVLWCFDAYLSRSENEKAVRSFPMVMKTIYDQEWASEEELLQYYDNDEGEGEPGFDKAKTASAPFLKWLKEAEESDEDDDDSEEDN